MKVTAIKALLQYLEQERVRYIFGIPGGPLMPLYDTLYDTPNITPILSKHEEGAAFMANGYARVSGELGVCCATTGPGTTNLFTGTAVCYTDSVPVLFITAQVATAAFGKGAFQETTSHTINVVEMMRYITKFSAMPANEHEMPELVKAAIRSALTGTPGPVHINIPADFMTKEIDHTLLPSDSYHVRNHSFDRVAVKEAARYLLQAQRPAMLIGNGVNIARANQEVRDLAERLIIPVATTPKGKSAFPENHLLSLGVFGFGGTPLADKYLLSEDVDVLLCIGTSLGEVSTHAWDQRLNPRLALIQVDIDAEQLGKNYPVTVGITGDAKAALAEILYQINRDLKWLTYTPRISAKDIYFFKKQYQTFINEEKMYAEDIPLKPQRLIKDLRDSLPIDAIVFCDIGNHLAWAIHYFQTYLPQTFFHNFDFGAMGYATAAAIGGKLAAPNRPVISIIGDGCFAMNGMEVATAVNYNIPVIWVVFNDARLGMVYHGQQLQFKERYLASSFQRMDIARIAESLGAQGVKVERPGELKQVMPQVLASKKPTVIDCTIDAEEIPPIQSRIQALNRFFGRTPIRERIHGKKDF
ncbi:MAG: thiamine pyrophosphate-binding protein [bacterium]|nr:thiamine pyrophosphate-binding protein [bacterium]MDD5755944.1 thiamine pyrophosphate-binding protein [bacterium]